MIYLCMYHVFYPPFLFWSPSLRQNAGEIVSCAERGVEIPELGLLNHSLKGVRGEAVSACRPWAIARLNRCTDNNTLLCARPDPPARRGRSNWAWSPIWGIVKFVLWGKIVAGTKCGFFHDGKNYPLGKFDCGAIFFVRGANFGKGQACRQPQGPRVQL